MPEIGMASGLVGLLVLGSIASAQSPALDAVGEPSASRSPLAGRIELRELRATNVETVVQLLTAGVFTAHGTVHPGGDFSIGFVSSRRELPLHIAESEAGMTIGLWKAENDIDPIGWEFQVASAGAGVVVDWSARHRLTTVADGDLSTWSNAWGAIVRGDDSAFLVVASTVAWWDAADEFDLAFVCVFAELDREFLRIDDGRSPELVPGAFHLDSGSSSHSEPSGLLDADVDGLGRLFGTVEIATRSGRRARLTMVAGVPTGPVAAFDVGGVQTRSGFLSRGEWQSRSRRRGDGGLAFESDGVEPTEIRPRVTYSFLPDGALRSFRSFAIPPYSRVSIDRDGRGSYRVQLRGEPPKHFTSYLRPDAWDHPTVVIRDKP